MESHLYKRCNPKSEDYEKITNGEVIRCDTVSMKVDRSQFEKIVGNLLRQSPTSRKDERTGRKKVTRIVPPQAESDRERQPKRDKSAEKPEPSA